LLVYGLTAEVNLGILEALVGEFRFLLALTEGSSAFLTSLQMIFVGVCNFEDLGSGILDF
jgi:hypothetical protein